MTVLGKPKLQDFKKIHSDSASSLDSWLAEAEEASWHTPADVKKSYSSASILKDRYVIFNISGNKYRLKVRIEYKSGIVLVDKIGTHNEYKKW